MIDQLIKFFEDYPQQLLQVGGKASSDLDAGLLESALDYRERMLTNLPHAQYFRVDAEAHWMLINLAAEMKKDGLEELYSNVRLPFPAMLIEIETNDREQVATGLVVQIEDAIYTQRFIIRTADIGPACTLLLARGATARVEPIVTQELLAALGKSVPDAMVDDETVWNRTFLALAVLIATLLRHDGMLNVEEVSLYPRPMRRQAERSGRPLPDTLVSKIILGKIGRGQVEAMRSEEAGERVSAPRRTHWVRGHMMRSRAGEMVWRNPHLRGAGPLVKQIRNVTVPEDPDERTAFSKGAD